MQILKLLSKRVSNVHNYFLRKRGSFSVDGKILCLFYQLYKESVLSCAFICWYHKLSVKKQEWLSENCEDLLKDNWRRTTRSHFVV
mgnify:CR=1 FL=1